MIKICIVDCNVSSLIKYIKLILTMYKELCDKNAYTETARFKKAMVPYKKFKNNMTVLKGDMQ